MMQTAKFATIRAAVVAMSLGLAMLWAQNDGEPALGRISVDSLLLKDIGLEGATLVVHLSATANRSAELQTLLFDEVTVNGVKVYMPPRTDEIILQKGEMVDGLEFEARVLYRDLSSLDPLRKAVSDQKAHLRAKIRAQLRLNLFQRIVVMAQQAWVTSDLESDLRVEIPGGPLGKLAAEGLLLGAEPAWRAAQEGRKSVRIEPKWVLQDRPRIAESIFLIENRYPLRGRNGEQVTIKHQSLGFATTDGLVLAPAEVMEPWIFDSDTARAIGLGEVAVDAKRADVMVRSIVSSDSTREFSLRTGTLRLRKKAVRYDTGVEGGHSYKLGIRGRDSNVVLLELIGQTANPPAPIKQTDPRDDSWHVVMMFRIPGQQPEIIINEARIEEGRVRLRYATDGTSCGSPIYTEAGTLGILQDSNSGSLVNVALRNFQ